MPLVRIVGIGLLTAALLLPQTVDTASIRGRVLDPTLRPVAGVTVTLTSSNTKLQRSATTEAQGEFTFASLPLDAGYTVSTARTGFAPAKVRNVAIQSGTTAEVTIRLDLAPDKAEVTVTGVIGEIRTDAPQLADRITGRQLEETPLPARKISFLPLLNSANRPAINQGDIFTNQNMFTTGGAGRRQTWFDVDGGTGTDSWGRQTMFTAVPLAAVQEMTVMVNSFSAAYGGSAGSAVSVVTRTGGRRLRGQVVEIWRPAPSSAALSGFTSTTAANGNSITGNELGQTNVSLGGPIGRDEKTHFFSAGEFIRENKTSPITSPIAPGSYEGHYRAWLGFLKIDRQLGSRNTLFYRSGVDAFHDTNPNGIVGGNSLPTVARVFRRRTWSEALGETAVISPSIVNNARVQFQLASPITQFDPVVNGTQYQVPISAGGTFTTGTSQSALLMNRQYEANDTLTAIVGRHTLNFGGRMIAAHTGGNSKEFGGPIYLGQFVYNTCTLSLAVCESQTYLGNLANVRTYTQSYGNSSYTVNDVLWSTFAQDDFRPRRDLTLNAGIRYERQTFTDFKMGFAPRIGVSYNPGGEGKTVFRAGFGIYFSQIPDNAQANYTLSGPEGVFSYSATPGQIGFPTSVTAVPLPGFPAGAATPLRSLYIRPGSATSLDKYFPTSTLSGYQDRLLNPYSEQWTAGVERRLAKGWVLRADYAGSHTLRINRPLDVDAPAAFVRTAPGQTRTAQAANCTRPYWIAWYASRSLACNTAAATNPQPPYSVIQSDVNNGYARYHSLQVNLNGRLGAKLVFMASYTWSHVIDNVDPDVPGQNPNDARATGRIESGNAIFDQRHRAVLSGVWVANGDSTTAES